MAAFVPPAGPGRVLITSQNPTWPPASRWMFPCSTGTSRRVSWSAGPVTRTGRRPGTSPTSWAGCRWRWSRPPRTSRPPGTPWPVTWPCSGSDGPSCWPVASPPGTTRRWPAPGRWRSPACSRPRRARSACCGCWRSARPRQSRCACCCSPAPGSPDGSGDEVARCWRRCWRTALAGRGRHRGAAPVFAGHPGCGRVGVGAPAGAGGHRRPDARGAGQAWRQAAAALIEAAIPADTGLPETWPVCAALLPHAQAALDLTATACGGSRTTSAIAAVTRLPGICSS